MPLIRTFISHADDDKKRIEGTLRKLSPFGIRPWLDREELMTKIGGSLSKAIHEGITQECQSMILFLSENSVKSKWVEQEVESALHLIDDGFRIIPVYLDAPEKIELSEPFMEALRLRSSKPDAVYLTIDDPLFCEKVTASLFSSCRLDEEQEFVLHLGHRLDTWSAQIPQEWSDMPALDLRLNFPTGNESYSPTAEEWGEIEKGLRIIKSRLRSIKKVRVCGFAPLGVAALVGHVWDRGTNVQISCWNDRQNQEWHGIEPQEELETENWTSDKGSAVVLEDQMNLESVNNEVVVALMYKKEQADQSKEWSLTNRKPWIWFRPTRFAGNPGDARSILLESIGAIRWTVRTYPQVRCVSIVTGLPLAMIPLLVQQLKRYRKMCFLDHRYTETDPSGMYQEAATWT